MPIVSGVADKVQCGVPSWSFATGGVIGKWDWETGPPDLRSLQSVRQVRSSTYSRNVPVHACSMTTGTVLTLESGLEHVLMMWLDRQGQVSWLVAQPALLTWPDGLKHYPDLLSVDEQGEVTVWDARPEELQDIDFHRKAERTEQACTARGWLFRVFGGLTQREEVNLRWLATARRSQPWLERARAALREMSAQRPVTLGDVIATDPGGYLTSAMWHLAWRGELVLDLDSHWDQETPLTWAVSPS